MAPPGIGVTARGGQDTCAFAELCRRGRVTRRPSVYAIPPPYAIETSNPTRVLPMPFSSRSLPSLNGKDVTHARPNHRATWRPAPPGARDGEIPESEKQGP